MNAYITDISTPFGRALSCFLKEKEWHIYSTNDRDEDIDHIDILIVTDDVTSQEDTFSVCGPINTEIMMEQVEKNDIVPIKIIERLLSKLENGAMKRICAIACAPRVSISHTPKSDGYGYALSKIAFLQSLRFLFNLLRPEGYTFRLFDPMQSPEEETIPLEIAAKTAASYFISARGGDPYDLSRSDENRYCLRDALGREWPW